MEPNEASARQPEPNARLNLVEPADRGNVSLSGVLS
jgi:hypothetical protein